MGAVYLARDVRLDRLVALKVLPSEFATQPTLRDRFLRETRMAASFSHPNIVPVYAVEEADDLLAFAMAYIEGESLGERVKRAGPLSVRDTVRLLQDVGYALAYAHGRGVVHRDIKPDNIMIERATGRALVMDFGVSRAIATNTTPAAGAGLTRVGEIVGTPEYMSPEQASGDEVDGRSDIYSLGLTSYVALVGQSVMRADSTGRMLAKQITEVPPLVSTLRGDVPAKLAEAIERCVAKEPDARFARAENFVEALEEAQLVGPEIPLPVRVFAQEAASLSLVLMFGGFILLLLVREWSRAGLTNLDSLIPVLLLSGVLMTRVMQTVSEARRLVVKGFSAADIHRGMAGVLDERAERRAELRADERTRRARTRTIIAALAQFAVATALMIIALRLRVRIPNGWTMPAGAGLLVVSAAVMFGVSIVLLLRSPFRMPLGEAAFRLVWLGPVGRAFYWLAARGAATSATAPAVAAPSRVVAPAGRSLEQRVAELERWRKAREE